MSNKCCHCRTKSSKFPHYHYASASLGHYLLFLKSHVHKTLQCYSVLCPTSHPATPPTGLEVVCVCMCACGDTAEASGIIECSLVPREEEVVTVQSLQTQIYQYADGFSSSPLPSSLQPPPTSPSLPPQFFFLWSGSLQTLDWC